MSIKDLKNTTVMSVQKFHTKYWILKVYIEIVHKKNFEFNCEHYGKNFYASECSQIHVRRASDPL